MNTAPATPFLVEYLDGTNGWVPTNLGLFRDRAEAAEASRPWREGYARSRDCPKPPVRVVPATRPKP